MRAGRAFSSVRVGAFDPPVRGVLLSGQGLAAGLCPQGYGRLPFGVVGATVFGPVRGLRDAETGLADGPWRVCRPQVGKPSTRAAPESANAPYTRASVENVNQWLTKSTLAQQRGRGTR